MLVATSIWGVRASNGVIAIQTKNGNYRSPLQVSFTANAAYTRKTNIFKGQDFLSASEVVDIQKNLFQNGFYDAALQNTINFPAIPAVAEILEQKQQGRISELQANQWLDSLRGNDVRKDLDRFFTGMAFSSNMRWACSRVIPPITLTSPSGLTGSALFYKITCFSAPPYP